MISMENKSKTMDDILTITEKPTRTFWSRKELRSAMQEYADQQLVEYKRKLKETINNANYLGQVSKNNIVNTIDTTVI